MSVLPDNGAKVRDKADQIQALILSKESFQQVTDRLSRLGVGEDSIASSTVLGQRSHLVTVLQGGIDSDDEGDCVGGDGDNDGVISSENDVVDMDGESGVAVQITYLVQVSCSAVVLLCKSLLITLFPSIVCEPDPTCRVGSCSRDYPLPPNYGDEIGLAL